MIRCEQVLQVCCCSFRVGGGRLVGADWTGGEARRGGGVGGWEGAQCLRMGAISFLIVLT